MIHSVGLLHDKHNTLYIKYPIVHYSIDTSVVLVNITIRNYDVVVIVIVN